jgi:GNAT superfamily N-acetyltransferase
MKPNVKAVSDRYLGASEKVRYEWGRSNGVHHSSVYVGSKLVGTIGLQYFDRDEISSQCREDFEWVLREIEYESNWKIKDWHIDKWVVFDVWLDEPYRGKGIGYKMYENIFQLKYPKPTLIVGYKCKSGGTTSWDAERVYKKLARKYIAKGLVISSVRK